MSTHGTDPRTVGHRPEEPASLAELRGDCARMSSRWSGPADAGSAREIPVGTGRERPPGVHVPERSARLLDGMSDYGD
jgi:hypothetical protein